MANKNQKRIRRFANKNQGDTYNIVRAYDKEGCNGGKPVRVTTSRTIATQHVPRNPDKAAKVARKPEINKDAPHWKLIDQVHFWNASSRAVAEEILASV